MAELLADTDRAQALRLAERARVLDPNATRALARLEGGFASPRAGFLHGPNTAISVAAIPAVPPRRAPPPPAPRFDDADGIESAEELAGDDLELDLDDVDGAGDITGLDLVNPADDGRAYAGDEEVQAELEQVDFFLAQAMLDEAMSMLTDLQSRYPGNEAVARKMVEVERMQQPPSEITDQSPFALGAGGASELDLGGDDGGGGFGNMDRVESVVERHSRPLRSLDPEPHEPSPVAVVAGGEKVDLSTHGDLGIAYKEMGLLDAAIGEFKLLTQDPEREVFALTMIGECCEAKGSLTDAIIRYKEGLNCPQITPEETIQLYYCLGSTFERLADQSEALYFYEKVAKRDPKFRDVGDKLLHLRPRPAHP
jgi:tetratricopeptide (TPR) repeat protein